MTVPASLIPVSSAPKTPIPIKNDEKDYAASNGSGKSEDGLDKDVENDFNNWLAILVNQPLLNDQSWNALSRSPALSENISQAIPQINSAPAPTVVLTPQTLNTTVAPTSTPAPSANVTPPSTVMPEIVASLTVGTPQPLSTQSETDPRIIAMGLTPQEIAQFKDQLTQAVQTASSSQAQAQTSSPPPQNGKNKTEQPLPVIVIKLPEQAVAPTPQAALNSPVSAQIAAQLDAMVVGDEAVKIPEKISALMDTSVDPVELRIAQKSTRADGPALFTPRSLVEQIESPVGHVLTQDAVRAPPKMEQESARLPTPTSHNLLSNTALSEDAIALSGNGFAPFTTSVLNPVPFSSSMTAANNVLQNITAAQSHPATQNVAAIITKATKQDGPQHIMLQLDPVDLGRMEIRMNYKKGDPLKVHLVVEKPDTMALFQRDQSALTHALNQAGIKTEDGSLSFELSHDGSAFDQALQEREARSFKNEAPQPSVVLQDENVTGDLHHLTPMMGSSVRYSVIA